VADYDRNVQLLILLVLGQLPSNLINSKSLSADPSYLLWPYLPPNNIYHLVPLNSPILDPLPIVLYSGTIPLKYTSTTQSTVRQLQVLVKVIGVSSIKLLCSTTTTFVQVPILNKQCGTFKYYKNQQQNKNKKWLTPTLFLVLILYYGIFSLCTSATNLNISTTILSTNATPKINYNTAGSKKTKNHQRQQSKTASNNTANNQPVLLCSTSSYSL
jgi:hypothetical protein